MQVFFSGIFKNFLFKKSSVKIGNVMVGPKNFTVGSPVTSDPAGKSGAWPDQRLLSTQKRTLSIFQLFAGVPKCSWISKVPNGFSCGRGKAADLSCSRWENYEPISCSEIELKIAKERCPKYKKSPSGHRVYDENRKPILHCGVHMWMG